MKKLAGFDGMRAIACLAVLFHHLYQRLGVTSGVRQYTDLAEVGVSLFFVLSGALLSYPFWIKYLTNQPFPNIKRYAIHRVARIIPAFYLVLILSTVLSVWLIGIEHPWLRMTAAMLFVAPYHYLTFFPNDMNGPLWSIGLEVSCYLFLPLFLSVAWKLGQRHWLKPLIIVIVYIVLIQLINPIIIDVFMTDSFHKGWQFGIIGGAKQWLPYWNVNSFMGLFLCGSLASLVIAVLAEKVNGGVRYLFDGLALLGFGLAFWVMSEHSLSGQPSVLTGQPYAAPLFALTCGLILVALSRGAILHRIIDNWLFQKIATLSFGIYLWHVLIIELIHELWVWEFVYNGIGSYSQWLMLSAVVIVSSVVIAALSYRFFEKPILDWARRKAEQ
jgi:peptidoglycan/LPS O-acetylase OafA/YrhL